MGRRLNLAAAVLLAVCCVGSLKVNCAGAASPLLPPCTSGPDWRPLSERADPKLQAGLEQTLKRHPLWQSLIAQKKMAVGLVDLADCKAPRWARVNGQEMMYAASLPKLAILLTACQGFEDGTLKETPEIDTDLVEMIRRSDNQAANRMIERLGLWRIARVIQDPRYRFYDPRSGGGLWMGREYALYSLENPEPLQGLFHAASVDQVCRFYYLLASGKLVSPARSQQMLKILAFPDLHDKFVKMLEPTISLGRVYRKSGEWRGSYSDSILVWGESRRRYILAAIVLHPQGEQILRDLLPAVEGLLRVSPSSGSPKGG
ncbi:MAG: class A beta-lactamase-related serine hydrolase [Syntrophobacterales bacterium]|jgi:beta-lactamase class A|nr:class A beta-lactamase-related serine hydrolase [Syntrophobacterales bacterium]